MNPPTRSLPLGQAISALRNEVEAALMLGQSLPPGSRWEPQRITLTFQVTLEPSPVDDAPPEIRVIAPASDGPDPGAPVHTVTVEFHVRTADALSEPAPTTAALSAPSLRPPLEGAHAEAVAAQLSEILGAPGFDSAARASVLVEAWAGLSPAQVLASVEGLLQTPAEVADPQARRARHLLAGIVKSGPSPSFARARDLLGPLIRACEPASLLEFIGRRWKSQDDWL